MAGPEADLRGRRRGPRRHGPRAARLRSQARLPLRRQGGAEASRPTCSSAGPRGGCAVELNSATLPRLLVNRRYYAELKTRAAGQGVEGLAERVPGQRQLAGQGARPAGADDRQGRDARSSSASRASSSAACRRLKPLTLREVAEAIEMHESTVSRVTSNKYLLCDRGLFELKYFFGSGVGSSERRRRRGGRSGQGGDRQADRRRDRDPQRRHAGRSAQGARLRRRPPHGRQISRGDGHRLVDPAAPRSAR